jgi:hypothetical protein
VKVEHFFELDILSYDAGTVTLVGVFFLFSGWMLQLG